MTEPLLQVSQLSKTIGRRQIVRDISFQVAKGQIFGFLGPNGAGKTTTIRMLVGLIRPTSGQIVIDGYDLRTHFLEAMQYVGCIVENPDLYPYLTGYENLLQLARMQGDTAVQQIDHVVEMVRLQDRIYDKVSSYSLGMRQRLGIAQALLNNPKLLILDEPTNGLDPAGIRELRTFLQQLARDGMSIFISSHLLAEIQLLCDAVAMIRNGSVIRTGTIDSLLNTSPIFDWFVSPLEKARMVLSEFSQGGQVETITDQYGTYLRCTLGETFSTKTARIVAALADADCEVCEIRRYRPTLEDVFLSMTGAEDEP